MVSVLDRNGNEREGVEYRVSDCGGAEDCEWCQ